MKKIVQYILFSTLVLTYTGMMISCNHEHSHSEEHGHSHDHDDHDHSHGEEGHSHDDDQSAEGPHGEGAEFTSAYVCPMHCDGSGSDKPGTCPVCNMDYVAQADHVKDGHSH